MAPSGLLGGDRRLLLPFIHCIPAPVLATRGLRRRPPLRTTLVRGRRGHLPNAQRIAVALGHPREQQRGAHDHGSVECGSAPCTTAIRACPTRVGLPAPVLASHARSSRRPGAWRSAACCRVGSHVCLRVLIDGMQNRIRLGSSLLDNYFVIWPASMIDFLSRVLYCSSSTTSDLVFDSDCQFKN
jgi:hypothetical protein